jgi:transcriptional regulator with XRE-family HTH domain
MAKNNQNENAVNGKIGLRMKALRKEQNLTLAEVAAAASLSSSHLSQIERNKTAPSLMTVASVAEALNVSVRELFESSDPQVYLQRANRRGSIEAKSQPLHASVLTAATGSWQIQVTRLVIHPEAEDLELPDFVGEALGFVLEGAVGIELGDEIYELQSGDSIHFDASVGQHIYCQGEHPCTLLWCSSPPLLTSSFETL